MAELIPQEHGGAINRFSKGETGNLNGRPKKLVNQLKDRGYKKSEVTDAIEILIGLNEDELKVIAEEKGHTILEQIIAAALLESKRKKTLYNIETLITRIYGQPKQEIEAQVNVTKFEVSFKGDIKQNDTNTI